MIIIGLTGSIGMGKTTVANIFKRFGCGVHCSDIAARQTLNPNGAAFEEVALTFPEAWDKKKHLIKRDVLADIVFKDDARRQELENIIHPVVQASQNDFILKQKLLGRKIVVLDIPLLFETDAQNRMDYTAVVSAPYFIQERRVLKRPSMNKEKFYAILNTQIPDVQKRKMADFVIPTGQGRAITHQHVKKIIRKIS
jgi:dephospho-CoA kinase